MIHSLIRIGAGQANPQALRHMHLKPAFVPWNGTSAGRHARPSTSAEGETRTPKGLLPLPPQGSASTKFRHFGIPHWWTGRYTVRLSAYIYILPRPKLGAGSGEQRLFNLDLFFF